MSISRVYNSPTRQKNADETRDRIAIAARHLMIKHGFDGTTIDAIAREAGVSAQTVYAVFGSKRGIVAELMQRARFGNAYGETIARVLQSTEPVERLRRIAGVARQIFESGKNELDVLRGAGAVSPELATIGRQGEDMRYELQAPNAEFLVKKKALRAGVTHQIARDVIWTFTGPDFFRMLVGERGWSADAYEKWIADMMARALLDPKWLKSSRKPTKKGTSRT
jgi:AcrR family transcriptional regulator